MRVPNPRLGERAASVARCYNLAVRKLLLSLILSLPLLALPLGARAATAGAAAEQETPRAASKADRPMELGAVSDTPVAASAYSEATQDLAQDMVSDAGDDVLDCCHRIIERCHTVKPKCISMCHKCATPFKPCAPCLPELSGCHKPVTPNIPCAPCLPELCTCHKPAVVVKPEVCCDCPVTLTGSRDMIAPDAGCACGCHKDGSSSWAD